MCITNYLSNNREHLKSLDRLYFNTCEFDSNLSDKTDTQLIKRITEIIRTQKNRQITGLYILSQISDVNIYRVLLLRYCVGDKFDVIASKMIFSEKTVYRYHSKGVKQFDDLERLQELQKVTE